MYIEKKDDMTGLFSSPPALKGKSLVLRPLSPPDADALARLTRQEEVYRYLPTFLFEKKYAPEEVIARLYTECLKDSLILGIFQDGLFRGLGEIYGYRAPIRKASVGYRLLKEAWGKGIATEALGVMTKELIDRGIEIITASTMVMNSASARVLEKNGFTLVDRAAEEDWGFDEPTPADKWIL